jgi:hypothetical protein
MMRYRVSFLVVVVVGLLVCSLAYADIHRLINFQGRLTDASGKFVPDGNYSLTFRIYTDSIGGSAKWSEAQSVTVSKGLFNVILGSQTLITDSIFNYPNTYLGIQVGSDPEMSMRQRIVSVAYAYKSLKADTADYAKTATSDGDWTINGNNIYRLNGNIGLGTTNPGALLDVSGPSNKLRLSYDVTNYTDILTESDGDLFISPSSKKIWVNMNSADEWHFPKSYFTILAGNQPLLSRSQMIALNILSNSSTDSVVEGIDIWTQAYAAGSTARAMRINAIGAMGVNQVEGINIDIDGRSAATAYGLYSSAWGATNNWAGYFKHGNVYIQNNLGIGTLNSTNILTVAQGSSTDPIADAWTIYSSREYKRDVRELSQQEYRDALEKILSVSVVKFHYKGEDTKEKIGLIAEEAPEEILSEGNSKAISLNEYISLLHAALKAQQMEIELLKSKLEK